MLDREVSEEALVARNVEVDRTDIEQLAERGEWSTDDVECIHHALGVVGAAPGPRESGTCSSRKRSMSCR